MKKDTFTLKPGEDYIELNKLLKLKSIVQSGGHAKIIIEEGAVKVNGKQEFRKRNKLREGDKIEVEGFIIEVLK